jgi:hypothetical protein
VHRDSLRAIGHFRFALAHHHDRQVVIHIDADQVLAVAQDVDGGGRGIDFERLVRLDAPGAHIQSPLGKA